MNADYALKRESSARYFGGERNRGDHSASPGVFSFIEGCRAIKIMSLCIRVLIDSLCDPKITRTEIVG
jgi:hypothetical protein